MLCGICYGMVLSRTDGWLNARMIKRDETYLMTVSIVINCRTDRCIVRNTFCINEYIVESIGKMISLEKDNLVICVRAATRDSHELHPLIFLFSGCNYAPLRFHSSNRNVPVLITLTISRQYVKFLRGNKKIRELVD